MKKIYFDHVVDVVGSLDYALWRETLEKKRSWSIDRRQKFEIKLKRQEYGKD